MPIARIASIIWRIPDDHPYGDGPRPARPRGPEACSRAFPQAPAQASGLTGSSREHAINGFLFRRIPEELTMSDRPKILYTAEATATGGREGHARTSDGRLDVYLDVPGEMGGTNGPGTNPEQLFAAGYAACFQSAMMRFASTRELDLTGSSITARIGIGPLKTGGFGLAAALDLDAPQISREAAADLMHRAHEACPYSRATRGNIEVTLSVGGANIERQAA
jgi:osmotically inducible protein OsmC